jgi:hypothetical protein
MFDHAEKIQRECDIGELRDKYNAPPAATDETVCKIASRDVVVKFFAGLTVLYECDVRAHCVKKIRAVDAAMKRAKTEKKSKEEQKAIFEELKVGYDFFEQARWAGELDLEKKPACCGLLQRATTRKERYTWVPRFYRLLNEPEDGITSCCCFGNWSTAKKMKFLEYAGLVAIVSIELYGFWAAYQAASPEERAYIIGN